ncbi:MAG TPA: DUF4268 domain-containing protein [Roseiflexaceae bacterium]|nr:DUF4268 domain-containing protein [Roseiflexaceae bacterium]
MLFPIGEIIEGRELTTIPGTHKVSDALRVMITHDFSYLPVVDAQERLTGVISEQTIVRKYYHFNGEKLLFDLEIAHCQTRATTLPPTADIFDALVPLQAVGAIIVVDEGRPIGIITDYDTTRFFREYSEGIILAQDIEFNLRRHIEDVFPLDSPLLDAGLIAAFGVTKDQRRAGRPYREYNELTLWDHVQLIVNETNWPKFEPALKPREVFQKMLEPVRKARNQMAHFRGSLTPVQLDALKQASYWLDNRLVASALAAGAPEVVNVTTADVAGADQPATDQGGERGDPGANGNGTTGTSPAQAVDPEQATRVPDSAPEQPRGRPEEQPADRSGESRRFDRKYVPLEGWLREQAEEQTHIRVSFGLIEEVIGEPLPPSARAHSSWWANERARYSQAGAWLDAGWRVESVDLDQGRVVFRRANSQLTQLFFQDVLERLKQARPDATRASKPQAQNWFMFGAGKTGLSYGWAFSYDSLRVELYIDTTDAATNKHFFDQLLAHKDELERRIGAPLGWRRLDQRRASRIFLERPATILDPPEALEAHKQWLVRSTVTFIDAFDPLIERLEPLRRAQTEEQTP